MKELIEGLMEIKRKKGIMILDDILAHETHEKIKCRAMDRECWRNSISRT